MNLRIKFINKLVHGFSATQQASAVSTSKGGLQEFSSKLSIHELP